jgi:SAM-dependent methyltransferase
MKERTVAGIAKGSPLRQEIAACIRDVRQKERTGEFTAHRNAENYIDTFGGLRHFFKYVARYPESNVVVDIGTGAGRAMADFMRDHTLTEGISLFGTGLVRPLPHGGLIGSHNFRQTSAEVLAGFADESVGGIIALNSIGYCKNPEAAMHRIDEVLVPGGIIKATFSGFENSDETKSEHQFLGFQEYGKFYMALKQLGYDLAVEFAHGEVDIMVGIKPGISDAPDAKSILIRDYSTFQTKQVDLVAKLGSGVDSKQGDTWGIPPKRQPYQRLSARALMDEYFSDEE